MTPRVVVVVHIIAYRTMIIWSAARDDFSTGSKCHSVSEKCETLRRNRRWSL